MIYTFCLPVFVDKSSPTTEYLPYFGPNRRSDHLLVGVGLIPIKTSRNTLGGKSPAHSRRWKTAAILEQALLLKGVDPAQIIVMDHGREVIFNILDQCQSSDMVFMLIGHAEKDLSPEIVSDYARLFPEKSAS